MTYCTYRGGDAHHTELAGLGLDVHIEGAGRKALAALDGLATWLATGDQARAPVAKPQVRCGRRFQLSAVVDGLPIVVKAVLADRALTPRTALNEIGQRLLLITRGH